MVYNWQTPEDLTRNRPFFLQKINTRFQMQDLHINCILFLRIHISIAVIPLKSSEEFLGLSCCFPLTPSLREYLRHQKLKRLTNEAD